jgi:hypothetical protein
MSCACRRALPTLTVGPSCCAQRHDECTGGSRVGQGDRFHCHAKHGPLCLRVLAVRLFQRVQGGSWHLRTNGMDSVQFTCMLVNDLICTPGCRAQSLERPLCSRQAQPRRAFWEVHLPHVLLQGPRGEQPCDAHAHSLVSQCPCSLARPRKGRGWWRKKESRPPMCLVLPCHVAAGPSRFTVHCATTQQRLTGQCCNTCKHGSMKKMPGCQAGQLCRSC